MEDLSTSPETMIPSFQPDIMEITVALKEIQDRISPASTQGQDKQITQFETIQEFHVAVVALSELVSRVERQAHLFTQSAAQWNKQYTPSSSPTGATIGKDSADKASLQIVSPPESPTIRFAQHLTKLPLLPQRGQGLVRVMRHNYRIFVTEFWDGETPLKVRTLLTRMLPTFPLFMDKFTGASKRPVRKAELSVLDGTTVETVKYVPVLPQIIVEILEEYHGHFLETYLDVETLQIILAPAHLFYLINQLAREADVEFGVRVIVTSIVSHLLVLLTEGSKHFFRAGTVHAEEGFEDDGVKRTIPDVEMPPDLLIEVKTWLSFSEDTVHKFLGIPSSQQDAIDASNSVYSVPLFWPTGTETIAVPDQPLLQMATQILNRNITELGMVTSLRFTSFCAIFEKEPRTMYISKVSDIYKREDDSLLQHFAFAAIARDPALRSELFQRLKELPLQGFAKKGSRRSGHLAGNSQSSWKTWGEAAARQQNANRIVYRDVTHEQMGLIGKPIGDDAVGKSLAFHSEQMSSQKNQKGSLPPLDPQRTARNLRTANSTQDSGAQEIGKVRSSTSKRP